MSAALTPNVCAVPLHELKALFRRAEREILSRMEPRNPNDVVVDGLLDYDLEREIVFCGVCGHDFMWEHLPFYPTREGVKQPLCQRCATTPFPELHYRPERFSAVPGRSRRASPESCKPKRRPRVSPAVKFARAQALVLRKWLMKPHGR